MKKRVRKNLTAESMSLFINNGISIENRIIHIDEDIDSISAGKVVRSIQAMISKNKENPIEIYINTFGGCVYSSLFLFDFIKNVKDTTIKMFVSGASMSGGSIIMMAGDERYMFKNSAIMVHSVWGGVEGKVFELDNEVKEYKELYRQMCIIYSENTNKDYNYWKYKLKYKDTYIRAEEALKLGLIDKIIE